MILFSETSPFSILQFEAVETTARTKERACRKCGCTQNRACVDERGPCWWAGQDLCSHCPPD